MALYHFCSILSHSLFLRYSCFNVSSILSSSSGLLSLVSPKKAWVKSSALIKFLFSQSKKHSTSGSI
ncbi:hypothetical protein E0371_07985 [Campylobacter coli]|nr:hypothetical protein [Campylobacter coli]